MVISFYSKSDNDKEVLDALRQHLADTDVAHTVEPWSDRTDPESVIYSVSWGAPDNFFDGMSNLRAAMSLGAGIDHLTNNPGLPANLPIVRLSDAGMGEKIAEYVLYAALQGHRDFDLYQRQQQQKVWRPLADRHAADYRVGIMGLGVIGTIIADRLQVNGYQVCGWKRTRVDCPYPLYVGDAELSAFLGELDLLVAVLPLTEQTTGLIDKKVLSQLPAGARFVNVGRGKQVNESDLLQALDSGQLTSAVLDVCETEPLPVTDPLWTHEAVTLTPHVAGPTQIDKSARQIAKSIQQMERGDQPAGLVNRAAGY
jgi:glyoxylate/hydroxypyruvate reductase A